MCMFEDETVMMDRLIEKTEEPDLTEPTPDGPPARTGSEGEVGTATGRKDVQWTCPLCQETQSIWQNHWCMEDMIAGMS